MILEDGRKLLDAVGGAAVSCIGNGHPDVVQAIKDQVDKMSCKCANYLLATSNLYIAPDVYNMQLSNRPAEDLADVLVRSGNGAFELCFFVSGGMFYPCILPPYP